MCWHCDILDSIGGWLDDMDVFDIPILGNLIGRAFEIIWLLLLCPL